ncbi:MAG: right-handed parallel beta-helix repeat-containing protein, partial [bacterium]|nr:right-handed parallel beta-helix repeat-containing protein [bacterium]
SSSLPTGKISFREKFVNITTVSGTVSIDSINWTWLDSEVTVPYSESRFELWKYNSSNWTLLNDTPDITANTLSQYNLNPTSTFAILQDNASDCIIISTPGTYALSQNVVGAPISIAGVAAVTEACIVITSSNVEFSCDDYNITNNGTANAVGIVVNGSAAISYTNVTVENCPRVAEYEIGMYLHRTTQDRVRNVTAYNNTAFGFSLLRTTFSNVTNSTANENGGDGFRFNRADDCRVINTISRNDGADGFDVRTNSDRNLFENITVHNNSAVGFRTNAGVSNTLRNVTSYSNNGEGFRIINTDNSIFTELTSRDNNGDGIEFRVTANYNLLDNSTVYSNGGHGFNLINSINNTFRNTTSYDNTDGFRLSNSNNSLFEEVTSRDNGNDGFDIRTNSDNNTITNSTLYNNSNHGVNLLLALNHNLTDNNITSNGADGVQFNAASAPTTLSSNFVCYNTVLDLDNNNATNAGTLDSCDSWNTWDESGHAGCTFRCTEVWHYFYGDVNGSIILAPNQADVFYSWLWNGQNGKVYVVSINATIDWPSLIALGRNTSIQNSTNDFTELDALLGISAEPDNVNAFYSYDGSNPTETRNWTLFELAVDYIPVSNSSVFNTFYTGIAWDSSQDTSGNGQFDPADNEDVVFMTEINSTASNDYEIKVPETLATYKGGTTVEFWVELD